MGEKLFILGKQFNLGKIKEEHYQKILKRLLIVTDNFTVNGTIYLHEYDLKFAEKLDKETNPVGENYLAVLSQTIEAIKVAFDDQEILEKNGIFLTLSGVNHLNFQIKPTI